MLRVPVDPRQPLDGSPTREGKTRVSDIVTIESVRLALIAFLERGNRLPSDSGSELLEIRTKNGIHFQFGPSGAHFAKREVTFWGPRAEYLLERLIGRVIK